MGRLRKPRANNAEQLLGEPLGVEPRCTAASYEKANAGGAERGHELRGADEGDPRMTGELCRRLEDLGELRGEGRVSERTVYRKQVVAAGLRQLLDGPAHRGALLQLDAPLERPGDVVVADLASAGLERPGACIFEDADESERQLLDVEPRLPAALALNASGQQFERGEQVLCVVGPADGPCQRPLGPFVAGLHHHQQQVDRQETRTVHRPERPQAALEQ